MQEDECRLCEVKVKEETNQWGENSTTIETTTWQVIEFESLPEWLKDNEFLRSGHRPPLPSVKECLKSIWSIHTETGNIWTHLIGCVLFAFLAGWFLTRPESHIQLQEKMIFSFFFLCAIICLFFSFAFHTLSCHSAEMLMTFCKLDYAGISLLIVGSNISWIYYGFYCRPEPKLVYITLVCLLGLCATIISMSDQFSDTKYRTFRAAVFVATASSGAIPAVHYLLTDGLSSLFKEYVFHWLLLVASIYLLGAWLYATRTPERFFPGKCDIWFQSHQLFHTCVVIAALLHYYGISEMAMIRLNRACPGERDLAIHARDEI